MSSVDSPPTSILPAIADQHQCQITSTCSSTPKSNLETIIQPISIHPTDPIPSCHDKRAPRSAEARRARGLPPLSPEAMPALTLNTSPTSLASFETARSNSPVRAPRPPVSPITPTLRAAQPVQQTYTHTQLPQSAIPQPEPTPISLDENTDAIALRATMSILLLQQRKAEADIRNLAKTKERMHKDPAAFAEALRRGDLGPKKDALFDPDAESEEEQEEEEEEEEGAMDVDKEEWERLPQPQNIVRTPAVNWHKYGIVGESLDKLHEDQKNRPSEGTPQSIRPDGKIRPGGEGPRAFGGVAAPLALGKDRIDRKKKARGKR